MITPIPTRAAINLDIRLYRNFAKRQAATALLAAASLVVLVQIPTSGSGIRFAAEGSGDGFVEEGVHGGHAGDDDEEIGFERAPVQLLGVVVGRIRGRREVHEGVQARDAYAGDAGVIYQHFLSIKEFCKLCNVHKAHAEHR